MKIPALRQTHCGMLACEEGYATAVIEGKVLPASLASDRGQDIHHVMAGYIKSCAAAKIPADWQMFDWLAAGRGTEARKILRGMRSTYLVDHQHHIAAEITYCLDENFQPCPCGPNAWYQGTLDNVLGFTTRGKIEDFKSHPGPFDPDTPQAHLYPLLALQWFPEWKEVEFELIFVRYKNCRRACTWKRKDVPELMEYMQNYKERQVDIHLRYKHHDPLQALPGPHCQYCAKLVNITCPIAEFNPQMQRTPEERLRFNVWAQQLKAQNDEVLKSYVTASGENVAIQDGNFEVYEFGCWDAQRMEYSLPMVVDELAKWEKQRGEDLASKLVVGATKLNQYLKAKKRDELRDRIFAHSELVNAPRWGIRRPDGKIEGGDDDV
jgi:hypothetical protein